MVKHILVWKLKPELTTDEKTAALAKAKKELEALVGVVPGLLKLEVITNPLASSTGDMLLYSELENAEALAGYQVHPAHVAAATFVRSIVCDRSCSDFEC